MANSMGLCVVGIGSVSIYHLQAIQKVEGIHLEAVVSRSAEKARETAEEFGATKHYRSLDDAVSDPKVDGIVLCTPTQFHHQETLLCIHSGKHVLLEKPITDTYEQAVEVAHEAEACGVTVMAGQISRYLEPYARCRQIIARGGIGRPLHGIEHRLMHRRQFLSWFPGGTGHLINHWGSHPIDLFQWFFGSPAVRVYCHATASIPEAGGEDDVVLCMELANDAVGTYHHSYHARYFDTSMVLIGDAGTLKVIWESSPGSKGKGEGLSVPVPEEKAAVRLYHDDRPIFEAGVEDTCDAGFVDQMSEFARSIRDRRQPQPSAADTVITMAVVEAARKAAREHRVVSLEEIVARDRLPAFEG